MATTTDPPAQRCTLPHPERRIDIRELVTVGGRHLTNSNDHPSDLEVDECRRRVAEGNRDTGDLGDDILMAQAHLEHLKQELQELRGAIELHKAILASPRRLDTDVLMVIFRFVCQSNWDTDSHSRDSLDVDRPAWRLGQVCHRWRDIITEDMPDLWTDITLAVGPTNIKRRFVLEQLLRRSKGRLLDISLLFQESYRSRSHPNPLLQGLEVSCDRWRSLHIEGWAKLLKVWDASYLENNLPNLTVFSHRIHSEENPVISHLLFPRLCPRLTTLHMIGWPTLDSGIAWENLKRMTWSHETFTNVHLRLPEAALLRRCLNLESCTLDCVYVQDPPQAEHVSMRRLQDLTLHSIIHIEDLVVSRRTSMTEVERLLGILHLPALRSLAITGPMYATRSLVECLQQSQCRLVALSMPATNLDLESMERVLLLTPSLERLCILDQKIAGTSSLSVVKKIVDVATASCTQLHTIQINLSRSEASGVEHEETEDDVVLVEEIAELLDRWRGSSMIQSLIIRLFSTTEAFKVDLAFKRNSHMEAIVAGGFRVEITGP